MADRMRYGDLTYEELREKADQGWLAVLPTGCTEQQGPHLPVDFDTWFAERVTLAASEKAARDVDVRSVVLPAMPFGPTGEHRGYGSGYIDIPRDLHESLVHACLESLAEQGFRRIVVWRGCGGHDLRATVGRFNEEQGGGAVAFLPAHPYRDIWCRIADPSVPGGHADSFTTSITLHLRPEAVRRDRITNPRHGEVDWDDPEIDFTRYYVGTSLVVIVIITTAVAFLFVKSAERDFAVRSTARGSTEAGHVVQMFYHNVWAPAHMRDPTLTLADAVQPAMLAEFVRRSTFGLDVVALRLLDLEGAVLWSTGTTALVNRTVDLDSLATVLNQGTYASRLRRDEKLVVPVGEQNSIDLVRTYFPIRDAPLDAAREAKVVGVLQIDQDVTADFADARQSTLVSAALGSVGMGTILFTALLLIVRRADTAIARGHRKLRAQQEELEETLAELRRTQHQIVKQERLQALGLMASGIAHDLNNTLSPILGYSDLLLNNPDMLDDRETVARQLKTINVASRDAAEVIRRLRELYRPRQEDDLLTPVDVSELLEQAIHLTQPHWKDQAQANGVSVAVESDLREVPLVDGNEAQLREVVVNLILNAADAMPAGGTITLSTRLDGDRVAMEVTDTGVGMTEEVRQRCLEPFFSTKGERGTGLGLGVADGIIKRHGGSISVESELGKGTSITLRLPISSAHTAVGPDEVVHAPAHRSRPMSVLLVDDEPMVREVVAEYLTRDGHSVETATNGREGLERFRKGSFDLALLDRAMPELNGEQLATAIKRADTNVPVILLTGFGDLMSATGTKPDDVDLIVSKPATLAALREAVSKVTAG